MCGRFFFPENNPDALDREVLRIIEEINRKYGDARADSEMKRGEIFPTDIVPVWTQAGGRPEIALMRWGLTGPARISPKTGKPLKPASIINARCETAGQKAMFRPLVQTGRCLVPASCYFEWRHSEGRKTGEKYAIGVPDSPLLYMAALYRQTPEEPLPSFTILTRAASPSAAFVHDRMPMLLDRKARAKWMLDARPLPEIVSDTTDIVYCREVV